MLERLRRAARPAHRVVLCALLAVAVATACDRRPTRPPNVIVILVDTLRADRIGAYGSTRGVSPFVDEFAARSTVFRRAYAAAPWTNPSVASLFTSRWQSQHGVIMFGSPLRDSEVTLAEALKAHGYATAAFVGNFLIKSDTGFAQGFDEYDAVQVLGKDGPFGPVKTRATDVLPQLVKSLAKPRKGPLFLYLHYVEPHFPYSPTPAALERVLHGRPRPDVDAVNGRVFVARVAPLDAHDIEQAEIAYDAETLSLDDELRVLFTHLEMYGILNNALVIFTADHGDEFQEHGNLGHGHSLYEEQLRVPLIVSFPGQQRQTVVDDPVSLLDVAPTVLEVVGAPPVPSFEGRSLRPHWYDWIPLKRRRPVVSELIRPTPEGRLTPHERAIVFGDRKLIVGVEGQHEAYDLDVDPAERKPLDGSSAAAADGDALLTEWKAALKPANVAPHATIPVSPELREKMRALGYVQ